jgi:hypothetical protein
LEKCLISDTGTHSLKDDLKDFMALVPNDKVLEITLDYLVNDTELHEEVREFVVYIQSEKFPKIHKIVEYLKEYEDVSAFMCMFLNPKSDSENIYVHFLLVSEFLFSSV